MDTGIMEIYDFFKEFLALDNKKKKAASFHICQYISSFIDYDWPEKMLIDLIRLDRDQKLVIEYKNVKGGVYKIANKYYTEPFNEFIFKEHFLKKGSVTSLMEMIFWNTDKAIKKLKKQLHVKNKKKIYEIIGDAYGYSGETIRKQLSGTPKSINAELILYLEQEFNVHRDEILGPIRIKHYQFFKDFYYGNDDLYHNPNLEDVYRNFDFILAKDKEIEQELREMLDVIIKRLKNFLPHQKTEEIEQTDLAIKLSQEIAKITEFLSSDN
ncbi:hypothetical protein ACE198_22405 [Neobacillus sp. KR4-4]|uniref:hypothetical protein n=1 Tax=Neobacillus sp. KR4-4 TaxID=3344872 RepID=UPI0035CA0CE6